jgi:hypothetical protein
LRVLALGSCLSGAGALRTQFRRLVPPFLFARGSRGGRLDDRSSQVRRQSIQLSSRGQPVGCEQCLNITRTFGLCNRCRLDRFVAVPGGWRRRQRFFQDRHPACFCAEWVAYEQTGLADHAPASIVPTRRTVVRCETLSSVDGDGPAKCGTCARPPTFRAEIGQAVCQRLVFTVARGFIVSRAFTSLC